MDVQIPTREGAILRIRGPVQDLPAVDILKATQPGQHRYGPDHRCKNVFYVFYSCHIFTFFNVYFIFRTFFKEKTLKICFLCKLIVRFLCYI